MKKKQINVQFLFVYTYNYVSIFICVYIHLYEYFSYIDYMSEYTYFFFVGNRLHLIKTCLCCFLDIHFYCNSLSNIAMISSDLFPACFSCSKRFNLSQISSGFFR